MKALFTLKNKAFTASSIFIAATMFSSVIGFVFNAYMGRVLSVEDFGLITFINTLVLFASILMNALGSSVTHRVALLSAHSNKAASITFVQKLKRKGLYFSFALMIIWLVMIPFSAKFFNIGDSKSLLFFTPVFAIFLNSALLKGYLTGSLYLIEVSIATVIEGLTKLLFAVLIQSLGFGSFAYLAIPLSLLSSMLFFVYFTRRVSKEVVKDNKNYAFPRRFFLAAFITGLSSGGFLIFDLILIKHFLTPLAAGEYSLLSLAGKMIYFAGSIFNPLILTFVSRDIGQGIDPNRTFTKLILSTIGITAVAYIGVGVLGAQIMPLAFGAKVLPIIPYLPLYSFAIACFTIGSAYVIYHLARHHYAFSVLSLFSSFLMIIGICLLHEDIRQITLIIFSVSVFNILAVLSLHELQKNGGFLLHNLIDLADVFRPFPYQENFAVAKQRILIFNWRDTQHQYAGGAEVYIHELAKRWITMGFSVTQFCGNDGKNPRNEIIDGIQIIRRGGFYVVYLWAFIYYIFRLRDKYDVIIDTENGIPFFTPLYAKESIYCLMFHVHQEVFRKSLSKPLAFFACALENRLMPWAYRKTKFITISKSSKKEIFDFDLGKVGIEIINPGVDLKTYKPTDKKNVNPLIVYIGRLQIYKSVDVLIRSAQKIFETVPHAEMIIAGGGEEKKRLEKLVDNLGLKEKITFVGKVSEERKIELYQKAWVVVNPSLKEGWGITTIESNACGTPVVASDVPGLRDSVRNPSTGFLVKYGSIEGFSQKIIQLLQDNDLRKNMEQKSVKWAEQFDWQKSAEKTVRLLFNSHYRHSGARQRIQNLKRIRFWTSQNDEKMNNLNF
jgi:glycosyltransferase involved in cell wall biosynthesis/O-antigen/teichoic acid export membrane protein